MRRFLIVIGVLLIILAVLTEIVLPQMLSGMLKTKISQITHSQEVELSVDSSPRFLIAAGRVDEIQGEVKNGSIGDLNTTDLTLNAQNISVDMFSLLFGDKTNDAKDSNNSSSSFFNNSSKKKSPEDYIKSIGKVELNGIVDEDNLKRFLENKFPQIDNLKLNIKKEEIDATANLSIMGRSADLELSGLIIADGGDLYFRMTKLNVKNALLRHVQLDRFFGDFKLASADSLPLGLKFENVELQDGQVIVTAIRGMQNAD